jgi:hypothetical protein
LKEGKTLKEGRKDRKEVEGRERSWRKLKEGRNGEGREKNQKKDVEEC